MNTDKRYLKIAIPSTIKHTFDYSPPENINVSLAPESEWPIGLRFSVPFGKKIVVGVLISTHAQTDIPEHKIKQAIECLDSEPLLSPSILKLCIWISEYYHHPLGEVILHGLPKWLRTHAKPATQLLTVKKTKKNNESTSDKLKTDQPIHLESPLSLNAEQQKAIACINSAAHFTPFLLNGITGSGKTEVYFHVILSQLKQGKQALVLVPEIALTPQTLARFQERFDVPIALLHSGLTDRERAIVWFKASRGEISIVIGTRSAIFTPLAAPGIIILDEEHDQSFKQQSGLRYSARDTAIVRAQLENIPVVLGSATPSLESLYNCNRHRYHHLHLTERAGNAKPPHIGLIDLRKHRLHNGFSRPLIEKIEQHLNANQQVMLFLNRRGYAPVLFCQKCAWSAECTHCDARLTLHLSLQRLFCHHCGIEKKIPHSCGRCQNTQLIQVGQGTERLEETVKALWPNTKLIRIDRDNTRHKGKLELLLNQAHDATAQILIGTQMLAKGHHFPKLTLVAIMDADSGLFSSDFRALEKMAQLLIQVAGRAGRGEILGEVVMQTHQPQHPLLQVLLQQGYEKFAAALLLERQKARLPPFGYIALIRCSAKSRELAQQFLSAVSGLLSQHHISNSVEILGPIPALLERCANRFHAQLLLQSKERKFLHPLLKKTVLQFNTCKGANQVRWTLDVDPQELLN